MQRNGTPVQVRFRLRFLFLSNKLSRHYGRERKPAHSNTRHLERRC